MTVPHAPLLNMVSKASHLHCFLKTLNVVEDQLTFFLIIHISLLCTNDFSCTGMGHPENRQIAKIHGLSAYQCKLLSPMLTRYGMDKDTGKAKLLTEMGKQEMFDSGILGKWAFLIDPENIDAAGYGRDKTAMDYLKGTLDEVQKFNGGIECLIPIHVDGDGHCLVHAVSRALVGWELFWHALRENLKGHFCMYLDKYQATLKEFVDEDEWKDIRDECDPDFVPADGEQLGLRNIHIFGLANVLCRPIILLDSQSGLQSSADYSGMYA